MRIGDCLNLECKYRESAVGGLCMFAAVGMEGQTSTGKGIHSYKQRLSKIRNATQNKKK